MKPTNQNTQIEEVSAAWRRAARHEGIDHEELTVRAYSDSELFLRAVYKSTILEQHRYFYIAQRWCDFSGLRTGNIVALALPDIRGITVAGPDCGITNLRCSGFTTNSSERTTVLESTE